MAEEEMAMMGDQPPMESQMQMGAEQEAKQKAASKIVKKMGDKR